MRAQASGLAERTPRRTGHVGPVSSSRRGELAAGLATGAVVVELLLAPISLALTATLVAIGRLTRWRPHWLAVVAAAGLAWTLAVGPARAAAGFAGWPSRLSGYLTAAAGRPAAAGPARRTSLLGQAPHQASFLAYLGHWLPAQLPIAMLAASAQAAVVLWLGWRRRDAAAEGWRPGVIAAARLRRNAAALAAGHTVTRDGWALGLAADSGRLAGLRWTDAAQGVLLTGQDAQELTRLGLAAAVAAMRLRKTVVVIDLAGTAGELTELASSLGVPASTCPMAEADGPAGQVGLAIRGRSVLLVSGDSAVQSPGTPEGTGAVAGLLAVLASLRDLRLRGDCLAWITGCEGVATDVLTQLTGLGPVTGTAVLLSTTAAACAEDLGRATAALVQVQSAGRFTIVMRGRPQGPVVHCRSVQAAADGSPHRSARSGAATVRAGW
jgi:hypothetical protein